MTNLTQFNEVEPKQNSSYYATSGSIDTSSKYKTLSTGEVVEFFREKGFYISHYTEAGVRADKNRGKTKHLVRLRRIKDRDIKDAPEILITNSHNKYTSLRLNIGIYRYACANGLIMGDTFYCERLNHIGNNIELHLEKVLKMKQ